MKSDELRPEARSRTENLYSPQKQLLYIKKKKNQILMRIFFFKTPPNTNES